MKRILLIDTYNHIFRAFHALPKTFKDANGEPSNVVYGLTSMLISALDTLKPDYIIAAFDDLSVGTFRDELLPSYKGHRPEIPVDLLSQIPKVEAIIDAFGFARVVKPGFEADDIIGCFAQKYAKLGFEIIVVSNDKDLLQLLAPNIKLFFADSSKEGGSFFGQKEFIEKYGFNPINMIDYKGLRGDASDNIPGVKGVGEKTATSLIQKYTTLENLYEHLDILTPASLKQKLHDNKEMAFLSRQVATIVCDLDLEFDLENSKVKNSNRIHIVDLLKKYNFKSLIRRLGFEVEASKTVDTFPKDDAQLSML